MARLKDSIPFLDSREYDSESLEEDDGLEIIHESRSCRLVRGVVRATLYLLLMIAVVGMIHKITAEKPRDHSEKQCGTNPTEARDRGCLFEPMMSAWIPEQCSLPDVVQEFQDKYGDIHSTWPWFWDGEATQEVLEKDFDILRAGNYSAIYTTHFPSHDLHCLYGWRKISAARERKLLLSDAKTADPFHGTHCAEYVAKRVYQPEPEFQPVWQWPMMYHNCAPIEGA